MRWSVLPAVRARLVAGEELLELLHAPLGVHFTGHGAAAVAGIGQVAAYLNTQGREETPSVIIIPVSAQGGITRLKYSEHSVNNCLECS